MLAPTIRSDRRSQRRLFLFSFGAVTVIVLVGITCFWLLQGMISGPESASTPTSPEESSGPMSESSTKPVARESRLDEALEKLRNTPGTILISSVPLGVDVCIDEELTYMPDFRLGRVQRNEIMHDYPSEAKDDPRYVGETPLIVPTPTQKTAIYFTYPRDFKGWGGLTEAIKLSTVDGPPSHNRSVGVFVYYPTKHRNVTVLLEAADPKKPLARSKKYFWPSNPHFSDWNPKDFRSDMANMPSSEVDQMVHQLLCNGICTLDTSRGRNVYRLLLGSDGRVSYLEKTNMGGSD